MRSLKKQKGYTLIEVLMVLAIIGILLALSAVAFLSARKTSRDAKRKTDLEQIRGALETYKADNNVYPGLTSTPALSGSDKVDTSLISFLVTQSYISVLPQDPLSTLYYYYVPLSNGYALCAYLEGGSSASAPDCTTGGIDCGIINGSTAACNYEVKNP